jgi:FkbM family methyltransferase
MQTNTMPSLHGAIERIKRPFLPNVELDRYKWLRQYITQEQGFFVEAGANNGLSQSNTLYLERDGWSGLLIEPIPALHAQCRLNRHVPVEGCALVPPEMAGQLVPMTYANLMSVVDGIGSAHEQEAHLHAARPHLRRGEELYRVEVPGRTLTEVFDMYDVGRVDLLCLDLEGFEAPALRGLDFWRFQPEWLLIEARHERDVETVIGRSYVPVARSGDYDVLYHLKRIG